MTGQVEPASSRAVVWAPGSRHRRDQIWDGVAALLTQAEEAHVGRSLDVVDVGGGSGAYAVQIAAHGHRVTVVDPSPNALATLERRALDADVADRIVPVQGDASDLPDLVPSDHADLLLCHGVLNVVDDPASAIAALARVADGGAAISVVVAARHGAVMARAFAGHVDDALAILGSDTGTYGAADPLPRRFTVDELIDLHSAAGLSIRDIRGVRTFGDVMGSGGTDEFPDTGQIEQIDDVVAAEPAFRSLAATLHVLAERRS